MKNILEQAFLQVNIGMLVIDKDCNIVLCNHYIADQKHENYSKIVNRNLFEVFPELPKEWLQRRIQNIFLLKNSSFISWRQRPSLFDFASSRPITGIHLKMIQNCALLPIIDEDRQVTHVCLTVNDVTTPAITQIQLRRTSQRLSEEKAQQQKLIKKLEEARSQLLQSEKMASIGQLAAGVAHEINNPVGFIKSNFSSLQHYAKELNETIHQYSGLLESLESAEVNQKLSHINQEHDLEFVLEDLSNLLTESFDGISRIEEIVKSLKHFSRADSNQWESADINAGVESTLKVVAHELKYIAEIERNLGELPLVQCLPMQINQVIMNLLVNASQAIDSTRKDGKVSVTTSADDTFVYITVSDNGKGIAPDALNKIFDPFFTTKPVGKGTGLGLSLSYSIAQKHSGDISVESELDVGTRFTLKLPIYQTNESEEKLEE